MVPAREVGRLRGEAKADVAIVGRRVEWGRCAVVVVDPLGVGVDMVLHPVSQIEPISTT